MDDMQKSDLKKKNYFSLICDLVRYIERNHIPVGGRLPDENKLAEDLYTCRPTLRETMKILEVFGILKSRRGSGSVYIRDLNTGFVNMLIVHSQFDKNNAMDFISFRAIVEAHAVESFVKHATPEELEELSRLNELMKKKDPETYLDYHCQFHMLLLTYLKNDMAREFVLGGMSLVEMDESKALEQFQLSTQVQTQLHDMACNYTHDHICRAILSGDAMLAKQTVIEHVMVPSKPYSISNT